MSPQAISAEANQFFYTADRNTRTLRGMWTEARRNCCFMAPIQCLVSFPAHDVNSSMSAVLQNPSPYRTLPRLPPSIKHLESFYQSCVAAGLASLCAAPQGYVEAGLRSISISTASTRLSATGHWPHLDGGTGSFSRHMYTSLYFSYSLRTD